MVILDHQEYTVIKIEPEQVDQCIDIISPLLSLSIPYISEFETLEKLIQTMRQGMRPWQLWVILKNNIEVSGAFITTLEKVGNDLLVNFEILAGLEAKEWIWPLVEKFEKYMAFMYKCTGSRIIGRKGWEKFLKSYGYTPTHFITVKKFLPQVLEAPFKQNKIGEMYGEL